MFVRLYTDSVDYPDYWQCQKIKDVIELSPGLASLLNPHRYLDRGESWTIDLEYLKSKIVLDGLYDQLHFYDA